MNDDELIERLRRTLAERAAALEPGPGQVPPMTAAATGPDPSAQVRPAQVRAAGVAGARSAGWADGDPYLTDVTDSHPIVSRTGPVPLVRRPGRRRAAAAGAVAILAAAAAVAVGVDLSAGTHRGVAFDNRAARGGGPGPGVTSGTGPQSGPTPSPSVPPTSLPTSPTTIAPPTSAPPTGSEPVPAGFRAFSATFVSPAVGWTLGISPCGPPGSSGTPGNPPAAYCPELATTTDGGRHWHLAGAPAISEPATGWGDQPFQVRFADGLHGWIWTTATGAGPAGSQLWSTADGGLTWSAVPDPAGPLHTIADLETSAGRAHLVVFVDTPPYPAAGGRGTPYEAVYSTPVGENQWQPDPVQPDLGAGPVPQAQLVLWGSDGWVTTDNRTAVSAARLTPAGWSAAEPVCSRAHGSGLLAASSATDLVAVCAEGAYGSPQPGTTTGIWLLRSSDGGTTWVPAAAVPTGGWGVVSITAAPGQPGTVVIADTAGLLRTTDGGRTWARVHGNGVGSGPSGAAPTFVGFTTAAQAVAVDPSTAGGLLMSRDGGATWQPVVFAAG